MTTFIDGPAGGKTLMLKRAPLFLRVTKKHDEIDALDQLDDTPRRDEEIFVYVRQPGAMLKAIHLNTGSKPGGGWFSRASYKLSELQPLEMEMRTNEAWRVWCEDQAGRLIKA